MTAPHTDQAFLSTLPASPRARRLAWVVVLLSAAVFAALAPFAKAPLARIWAFIPVYESALVICDVITAILLFGQFHSFRMRSLFVLAAGYLFSALIAVVHMLTYPGVFSETGLLGAGPQTTAWLYMFWHGGFPLFIIAYALLKRSDTGRAPLGRGIPLALTLALVPLLVAALALLVTVGQSWLPDIMAGHRYSPAMIKVIASVWFLSVAALAVLWRCRAGAVLDMWLMVVMCAWLVDIALSAMLNGGRFDLGFYAGRIYGLLAASFVLLVLLLESGMMYARLLDMMEVLRRLTSTDALTGIANRRAFDEELDREWRRAMRTGDPIALLMIDVDCFKLYNDTRGHLAGDGCLREVAQALASATRRAGDLVARYGGEEFAVLLPQTSGADAERLAQRMCDAVLALHMPHGASVAGPHVTVSIGVGSIAPAWSGDDADSRDESAAAPRLVAAADQALYRAKEAGRNRYATSAPQAAMHAA
jgi:diguanylate cyclase (GGDEF)-like protein